MPLRRFNDDIPEEQVRTLLWRTHQSSHQARIEHFHKTGRLVRIPPNGSFSTSGCRDTVREQEARKIPTPKKGLADRFLFFLELLAILGFTLVIVIGLSLLQNLNQKSSLAFELPPLTPTPLIRPVAIPSGHTPPASSADTRTNDTKTPPHLRPFVQAYANLPVPTQSSEYGIRIRIPSINVDAPIVQGDSWEQLKKGVAQRLGTADPGEKGNMVLSGHNDTYGEVFRYLDRLKPGDEIIIYSTQRSYTYIVTDWILVEPTQVDVMDPTPDATITLISCYPYLIDTQRIIVKGRFFSKG